MQLTSGAVRAPVEFADVSEPTGGPVTSSSMCTRPVSRSGGSSTAQAVHAQPTRPQLRIVARRTVKHQGVELMVC